MGLCRFCSRHYLVNFDRAGGVRAMHGDLRDGLLGVLILWFLCCLGPNKGNCSQCDHKGQLTRDTGNPHGLLGSENTYVYTVKKTKTKQNRAILCACLQALNILWFHIIQNSFYQCF